MNKFLKVISIMICTLVITAIPIFVILSIVLKWSIIVQILMALLMFVEIGVMFIGLLAIAKD